MLVVSFDVELMVVCFGAVGDLAFGCLGLFVYVVLLLDLRYFVVDVMFVLF